MPTKQQNIALWKHYSWSKDGDEWDNLATEMGNDYDDWKRSLVAEFITPHLGRDKHVLEIGCGHGRWSTFFVRNVAKLYLCDITEPCLDFCRKKFGQDAEYFWSDESLAPIADSSIDLVWSFDVMVHVDPDCIHQYVMEVSRVLKPGGTAILHHADNHTLGGWRSKMTADFMRRFATEAKLTCLEQRDSWGSSGQFSVKLLGDMITTLSKT